MNFQILTIFPEFFDSVFSCGLLGKAAEQDILDIDIRDIRKYSTDKHNTVDDRPYGGGSGMLMKPEPLGSAIEDTRHTSGESIVILTSPQGELLNNSLAREISAYSNVIIVCGRYEGVDERVKQLYVDKEISVGDYVLSGGEYAAAVIVDTVSRYIPGVVGNINSVTEDTFEKSLLKYPQYTRPEEYRGITVPRILLSGDHNRIHNWRRKEALRNTFLKRPDLLDYITLDSDEYEFLSSFQSENKPGYSAYISLIHYPVYNKDRRTIASAFTNIDVHDIARASKTYDIKKFFLVNPVREQQELVERVVSHWVTGAGAKFNPKRKTALENVEICSTIDDSVKRIEELEGKKPRIVATDAKFYKNMIGYNVLRKKIMNEDTPYLIMFGTGWGLTDEIMSRCDYILKPVKGYNKFNHLSVRSAVSIILDRLFSCKI